MKTDTLQDCFDLLNEADGDPISKGFAQQLIMEGYRAGKIKAGMEKTEPLTDTYIQTVPDKCDRIVWRGNYYHLPMDQQNPLTPQEWWSLAPWKPMDSAPMNGTILIETAIGKVGGISYESALMKKHLFETTNAIAWLPLPEIK